MIEGKSRWADDADATARQREKEEKKRLKLEKQKQREAAARANDEDERAAKRQRLSPTRDVDTVPLLRFAAPGWGPCRHVDSFERLNHIEEGSYGSVSRAKESATGTIVALKKLKMDGGFDGFPVTALREIETLQRSKHKHIVNLREVVVGNKLDDVFLVMDFLEHDLKTLQEQMMEPFLPSEVKTLVLQITSGIQYLHDNWILHRDLKTSNILMNNRGEIKLADFGMARQFSDPPPSNLTRLVVTLWYRAPELLLGTETYGPAIDMWSLGCVFGELVKKEPLLQGRSEADQLSRVFALAGAPTERSWPTFRRLPNARGLRLPPSHRAPSLRSLFPLLTAAGTDLLGSLLALDPDARPTAVDVLEHEYFSEAPRPKATALFPTFPSKAGGERRRMLESPSAPRGGEAPKITSLEGGVFAGSDAEEVGAGFALRMA